MSRIKGHLPLFLSSATHQCTVASMRFLFKPVAVALAAAALSTGVHIIPTEGSPYPPPILKRLTIVNKSSIGGQIGPHVFASCQVFMEGGTCTITTGLTVSKEVQLTFGMTWAAAVAQLGIGSSKSISTTVSCSSPALPAGSKWQAWPVGRKYFYNIRRQTIQAGRVLKTETSPRLTAFNPSASHIACGRD